MVLCIFVQINLINKNTFILKRTNNIIKTTIFQCIPCYKPLPTIRIIKSILQQGNYRILLDVEDSIGDVFSQERDILLKTQARIDFNTIITSIKYFHFDVRINHVKSKEFKKDKQILIPYLSQIRSVFIPKIEGIDDLEIFFNHFPKQTKICLIIESLKGIENLENILKSKYVENIEYLFFGNYDYHLSQNSFPIKEQYTDDYWGIVSPIIKLVEKYNCNFGNSPYTSLNDFDILDYAFKQLTSFCTKDFAVMSLHKNQSFYFNKIINKIDFNNRVQGNINYQKHQNMSNIQLKGRSFALDKNQRIITPQEQLLMSKLKVNI